MYGEHARVCEGSEQMRTLADRSHVARPRHSRPCASRGSRTLLTLSSPMIPLTSGALLQAAHRAIVTTSTPSDGAPFPPKVGSAVIDASLWSPTFSEGEPIVSYSQNAEDVRLWRVFRTIENGFYVDVGAADPYVDSVTHLFYKHGWSGINVEPSPCFEVLSEARTRDVNLRIAIGEAGRVGSVLLDLPLPGYVDSRPVRARERSAGDRADRRDRRPAAPPRRRFSESMPPTGRFTSSRSMSKERSARSWRRPIGPPSDRSSWSPRQLNRAARP